MAGLYSRMWSHGRDTATARTAAWGREGLGKYLSFSLSPTLQSLVSVSHCRNGARSQLPCWFRLLDTFVGGLLHPLYILLVANGTFFICVLSPSLRCSKIQVGLPLGHIVSYKEFIWLPPPYTVPLLCSLLITIPYAHPFWFHSLH